MLSSGIARLLSEEGVLREIHPLSIYYGIGEEMSREKKVEKCRNGLGEGGSIFSISLKSKKDGVRRCI